MSRKTHGLRHHPLYKTWDSMMQRCNNPKHGSFKNYGKRGVYVSEEFKDCSIFISYLESLPNYSSKKIKRLTIDRIDNSKGYERDNIKWSSRREQMLNTRIRSNNKSGYKGVSYIEKLNKYRCYYYKNGKQEHLGLFDSALEAHNHRNSILNAYPLDLIK